MKRVPAVDLNTRGASGCAGALAATRLLACTRRPADCQPASCCARKSATLHCQGQTVDQQIQQMDSWLAWCQVATASPPGLDGYQQTQVPRHNLLNGPGAEVSVASWAWSPGCSQVPGRAFAPLLGAVPGLAGHQDAGAAGAVQAGKHERRGGGGGCGSGAPRPGLWRVWRRPQQPGDGRLAARLQTQRLLHGDAASRLHKGISRC